MKINKMREQMTRAFVNSLKEDEIPWHRDWSVMGLKPFNGASETIYHGINALWLSCVAEDKGYEDPRWYTYKQAQDKGYTVKKGEKGTHIEFWSLYDTKIKKKLTQTEAKKLEKNLEKEEFLKRVKPISNTYVVFNAAQIDGVPEIVIEKYQLNTEELISCRNKLIFNMNVGFNEGGDRAYYSPAMDIVNMPEIERFKSEYAYMSTFLHEAAHASGASSRLNRDMTGTFGSQDYAREELRAEIASAFTAQATGIHYNQNDCMENHKAYVQSWISILENNPNELFSAIKDAEKISDYLIEKGEFDLERNVNLKNVEQNNILSAPHSQEEKKTAELLPKGWNWIINNEEGSGYLCSPENNKYFLFDLWAKQIEDLSGENNYFSGNISDLKIYEKIMKDYLSEHLHKIKNIPNNVTILFGANTKDYRYVKTPQAAIDEDIFIDSNTFNEWYERAETAERNWFSDHTTSTVEFAKKIANAVKNNNDSFEFEHEIFNVAEAMNKGKIHISKLKILDELTQEERELLQMNIEDLKDVDLNDFINSKTEERFERISQEPDISFEKWYIDNGYNPTMIPSDSAIPEAIIGITVPNTSHSFEKVKSRFSQIRYYKAAKDEYNLQVKAGNVPMKEVKKPLDLSKESDCAYCRMMIKKAFKNGDLETAKQWQDFYKNNIPIKKQKHMTL